VQRIASGELERELNLLDPHKVGTWDPASRRPYRGYPKLQLPPWHQYRVEFDPRYAGKCAALSRLTRKWESVANRVC
jgi:hypothetical protein